MPTIALLAQKGGSGKTTLAVHLAALAGPGTILADLDPQRSAADWAETRAAPFPEVLTGDAEDLRRALPRMPPGATIIVDTAPHAEPAAARIAEIADLIVIPTRPAILDLRAIGRTVAIVRHARRPAAIVINAAPPGRGVSEASIVAEARRELAAYELPVAPVTIGHRAALSYALNDGRAVTEFEPDGKAADEIKALWAWMEGLWRRNAAR